MMPKGFLNMELLQKKFLVKDAKRAIAFFCLVFSFLWIASGALLILIFRDYFGIFGDTKF